MYDARLALAPRSTSTLAAMLSVTFTDSPDVPVGVTRKR